MNQMHSNSSQGSILKLILGISVLAAASLIVVACSNFTINGTLPTPGASKVTVVVSDPATCQSPNGPYSHVYVTIADVRANQSDSAGLNELGWVDMTPNLSSAPMQVDLLGTPDNHCFLATLGEIVNMQPGAYKQFRVLLAPGNPTITSNACGNSANCVVLASDSSVHPLEISGEATNGIVLTASKILGDRGAEPFFINVGQSKNLNINFLACESIIQDEQGGYRLKPALTAGEAKSSPSALHGKVVDGATGQAVKGTVMVAMERQDGTGVSKIVRTILADPDGSFVFCPRPSGAYDLAIVGTGADGTFYEPSILFYVPGETTNIGNVKLYPLTPAADSVVTLTGKVTSQDSSNAATAVDATVSILESSVEANFTIPMSPTSSQNSATLNVATTPPDSTLTCPTNSYCADYSIQVPAGSANFADFKKDGTHLRSNSTLATYIIDGVAFIPSSGGVLDCNSHPHPFRTQPFTPSAGGITVPVPTITFKQCQ